MSEYTPDARKWVVSCGSIRRQTEAVALKTQAEEKKFWPKYPQFVRNIFDSEIDAVLFMVREKTAECDRIERELKRAETTANKWRLRLRKLKEQSNG